MNSFIQIACVLLLTGGLSTPLVWYLHTYPRTTPTVAPPCPIAEQARRLAEKEMVELEIILGERPAPPTKPEPRSFIEEIEHRMIRALDVPGEIMSVAPRLVPGDPLRVRLLKSPEARFWTPKELKEFPELPVEGEDYVIERFQPKNALGEIVYSAERAVPLPRSGRSK